MIGTCGAQTGAALGGLGGLLLGATTLLVPGVGVLFAAGTILGYGLAGALGGLDAIVVTAGIGEHAALVRQRVCEDAGWLGVELDPAANAKDGPLVSTAASRVPVWVLPTNEELMIARHTAAVLTGS